jgi:hypothetical protein
MDETLLQIVWDVQTNVGAIWVEAFMQALTMHGVFCFPIRNSDQEITHKYIVTGNSYYLKEVFFFFAFGQTVIAPHTSKKVAATSCQCQDHTKAAFFSKQSFSKSHTQIEERAAAAAAREGTVRE